MKYLLTSRNHDLQASSVRLYGFTIVELLIVIVVIAILASISVVAYAGIQERAQNANITSTLNSYTKALKLYYAENGTLGGNENQQNCLGGPSDYPAEGDWEAGVCMEHDSGWKAYAMSDGLTNQLASVATGLPSGQVPESDSSSFKHRGIYVEWSEYWAYFEYGVNGNKSCADGFKEAWSTSDGTFTLCNKTLYMNR